MAQSLSAMLTLPVGILAVLLLTGAAPQAATPTLQQKLQQLEAIDPGAFASDEAHGQAVAARYEVEFAVLTASGDLRQFADAEVATLFKAAYTTGFYSLERRHVVAMSGYLGELERRKVVLERQYLDMYRAMLAARMFDDARALEAGHPLVKFPALPALIDTVHVAPGAATEWVIDPDRVELSRRPVVLVAPVQIVVIGHPRCHFSQQAVRDIAADPALREVFARHAKWIAPQDGNLDFAMFQRWNREHPQQAMTIVHRRKEWPALDRWDTPSFYFLEHGVVVAKVAGWPDGGRLDALREALRRVSLLPADVQAPSIEARSVRSRMQAAAAPPSGS